MKYILCLLVAALLAVPAAFAEDESPSEASVRELLEVTNARALLDQMLPQIDAMMQNAMDQALKGQELSPAQRRSVEKMTTRVNDLMKEELRWDRLEAMYISIYSESFTQEEVSGMLGFYRTPAGQALIRKMPVVLRKSMGAMQVRMGPLMEKLQTIQAEVLAELEAEMKEEG